MPEFGVRLPVGGPLSSAEAIRSAALLAERLGYHAVWVHDFLVYTQYLNRTHISCGSAEAVEAAGDDSPPDFFEAITNLAFLAGATGKIRIGVSVLSIPYRHPLVVAKQLATIDVLSGGRLILGAGVGAPKTTHNIDFEVLRIPRTEKYERTGEYLRAMIGLWTGGGGYAGDFIDIVDVPLYPRPIQQPHPPIWISGRMERSLELLAEVGTGWFAPWLLPEQYQPMIDDIYRRAEAAGRSDFALKVATEVYVCVAESPDAAKKAAQKTLDVLNVALMPSGMASPDTRLIGSPKQLVERIASYSQAGVDHFEMKFIYHDLEHFHYQLLLFRDSVMSHFA